MSDELRNLSAVDLAAAVRERHVKAEEVVGAYLEAAEAARSLNALTTSCADQALARARRHPSGAFAGVPLVVKDIIETAGIRTTYGSRIFADHVPTRTATAVDRLERAGAIVVGKANLNEFAWGFTSQNEHWGDVRNPSIPHATPGGSSGGNAAALAAGSCALGLATDTSGSIRIPAACCGVVGFKPSNGAVPLDGCFPLAPSLDTVGPMARTVRDCAAAWQVLTGHAPPHSISLRGRRIGVDSGSSLTERLVALGATVVTHALPEPPPELDALFLYEAQCSHRELFLRRGEDYGSPLRAKWEVASRVDEAAYRTARARLGEWKQSVTAGMQPDLFVLRVLGMPLPAHDVEEVTIRTLLPRYTRPANLLGWAALAVGDVQFVGPSDARVLEAGLAWESHGAGDVASTGATGPP